MRGLVSLCVRHYGIVTALSVLALLLGAGAFMQFAAGRVPGIRSLASRYPNRGAGIRTGTSRRTAVTKRIESAVNGAAGLATMRSESIPGLSVVKVTFTDNVDVTLRVRSCRTIVRDRQHPAHRSGTPKLSPLVSSTMDLLKIGLLSDKVDGYALRDAADWVIKPRLLAVPGVAHVLVFAAMFGKFRSSPTPINCRVIT